MTFSLGNDREREIREILLTVYNALKEKGYNPINQMVGYILSEDPTYITTHNNARNLIRRIDRDTLLQTLVKYYMTNQFNTTFKKGRQDMAEQFLTYKGRPLVRGGNTIYYGNMSDEYVCVLQILSTKEENGEQLPDKIQIQLLKTDPEIPIMERFVKNGERRGLYNAMDMASIWLERALKEEK